MRKKQWISPSEEATEALQKEILVAIFPIVKEIAQDEEYHTSVLRILSAVETAVNMAKVADKIFASEHPKKNTHKHYVYPMDIVATCIGVLVLDEDIKDYPPQSLIGQHIQCFAAASRIISAAGQFQYETDCGVDEHGWDAAKQLMQDL